MAEERNDGSVIVSFLLGGLVGLGVGLLLAPITGEEARARVKKSAEIAKEKVGDLAEEVKVHAEDLVHQTKKILEDAKTHIQAAVETVKEAAVAKKEELTEKLKQA